jgi:hypothetical protein
MQHPTIFACASAELLGQSWRSNRFSEALTRTLANSDRSLTPEDADFVGQSAAQHVGDRLFGLYEASLKTLDVG